MTDLTQRLAALGVDAGRVDCFIEWRRQYDLPVGKTKDTFRSLADAALDELVTALEEEFVPKSWGGLLTILNDIYPASIFGGADDDWEDQTRDLGPRLVTLGRHLDRERARAEAAEKRSVENGKEICRMRTRAEAAEKEKTRVIQCNIYRLPVIALDVETGEQGVHWIDGYSTAEVLAVVHDDVPAPVYESVPKSVSESWVEAERLLAEMTESRNRWRRDACCLPEPRPEGGTQ